MKRKVVRIRLSPNEEAQLIREEHERRRKLRIQQVREQERNISLQIRREVQRRRQSELQSLEEQLREDWERQQRDKLLTLQSLYQESLQLLGQGHRSAKENEPDWEAIAQREEENHAKAEERYREALKELKSQRQKDHEEQNRSIKARKKALQAEKERSAKVASLPPPPPNPIENIESKKRHVVKKFDVNAFAATHYHMPEATVDREADTTQPDAREGAEQEVRRLQELGREAEREREEQLEKARLRGKHALRREQLMQDRERLLVELEHMQQTDLLRRRQQVPQMPPQIFQPLYKRQEMRDDCQREMEFAFEDMYTGERRVKGDLVLQLVPEPLPAPSTGSQDQELDVTLDDDVTPAAEHTHRDAEQETSARAEPSRPAPRRALRKLLDRIRSQRDQRSLHSGRVPAADPPTADPPPAAADQIPERDTTIDTGSLTSEERDAPLPTALPEPRSPPALETTEESIVAGTLLLPDVLANRIQEFEEERKKREEELEREKQQQIALLQELEEQKARLEQMLLEAQQERETLTAAVTQEVPVRQPEVPVHDQEVASATPGLDTEPVFPAGEDTRRIREYQQRLLEQNRLHKRSVEVARQRLEEYQRALRIRYNMTATSMLPPAVPAGLLHPPLHRTEGAAPISPPLQLPTGSAASAYNIPGTHAKPRAPVEIPIRDAPILAPPLPLPGLGFYSSSLPVQLESSDRTRDQRAGVPVRLTDDMMERVTEHLPERLRPSSLTSDPLIHRPFTTLHPPANVPLQPGADSIQAMSPNITDGPPPLPGQASLKPGTFLHESSQSGALDMERQRRELQEVQRRVLQQREEMEQQQEEERQRREEERRRREEERRRREEERRRRQEEERWRQEERQRWEEEERQRWEEEERWRQEEKLRQEEEEERDQMRRQREALQALISADAQPAAEADSEVLVSEDIGETRLQLLASLLRAIEESNGGTLSHLEEHQDQDGTAHQEPSTSDPPAHQSDAPAGPAPPPLLPPGLHLPPRAPKPPVSRVRLGVMEMMSEQHELSAIQEVETPVNASLVTGPEESVKLLPHAAAWDPQEESESSVASARLLHSPSLSSGGQRSAGGATGSGRSSDPSWRERLLTGAGSSPESSEPDSVLRILSPPSSDSGRGDDYSGPAVAGCRSPTESAHRPPDPDCLSSTTISTGSYITTDPEQNSSHTVDNSPPLTRLCVERGAGGGAAGLPDASSPSSQSSCSKDGSAAAPPSPAVDSLFHDSSIQRIIDKYTRELNISLHTAGNTTASSANGEGSYLEEPSCSASQRSWVGVPERRDEEQRPADCQPLPSDTETGAQSHGLEWDNTVNQILERFSDRVSSLAQDQEQDSFRPLIGQLADESSCLDPDRRDSAVAQLIGQPSAHSSMIAQLPGQSVSLSSDQGGWDSTLSRMIGRLSHQSSGRWQSGGQDFYAGRLIGRMDPEPSSAWLDEAQEESRMRPLLGELDESAGHRSGSSGERTSVDLGGSARAGVPSDPASSPEARSHSSSVPGLNPQDQILQTSSSLPEAGPERSEVFPASDSFHPLLAEVTHNETVDASMTFHLPVQEAPSSPERSGPSPSGERSLSPHSEEESETHAEPSVESEPSPEHFRAEEPAAASVLEESFCLLATSQCRPQESVLMVSSQEAELATLSLSGLTLCDAPPALDLPPPEGGDAEEKSVSDRPGRSVPVGDLGAGEPNTQQGANLRNAAPVWDKIMDAAGEKGILEQSEITLLSLTDSTLQDQEETITEEEERPDETREEGEKAEELESTLLPEETATALKEESTQTLAATLLEFGWSPSGGLQEAFQQKRSALLQRSSRRVEQIKRAAAKTQPEVQGPSEGQRRSKAEEPRPISCKAKTKSEPQLKTNTKTKGEQAEDQTPETARFVTAGSSKQKKTQLPPPVSDTRLKKVGEVKICTPEQRKRDVSEMHQRTQRLYEQLEEVKQQKERRSRQEANANNRLKAKEFHKKTLQKLRAKQTHQ